MRRESGRRFGEGRLGSWKGMEDTSHVGYSRGTDYAVCAQLMETRSAHKAQDCESVEHF